jgi:hypothetical protein
MFMIRFPKTWLIAAVAVGFVVGACKKADDSSAAGGGGGGTDDVALIPADSDVVVGLNFAQLQQSALWKQFAPKLMDKVAGKLTEFKAACGFDPMEAVKSVTFGLKNITAGKPDGVMVVKGLEKSKMLPCMDKYKAEAAKEGTEITVDGDVILMKDKEQNSTALTFVNDTTMIAAVGANGTKDGVKAAAKGTANSLKSSQAFNEMYSKINHGDSLWLMINGNSGAFDRFPLGKPKAVYGSINVTDGLALDGHLRAATADEAKSITDMAKAQADSPQVKQMFDKIDISNTGDDAHFVISMGNQKLQGLMAMMGGMLGAMGQ